MTIRWPAVNYINAQYCSLLKHSRTSQTYTVSQNKTDGNKLAKYSATTSVLKHDG